MNNKISKWLGSALAALLMVASGAAVAQKAQPCADEDGNPVACTSDGFESADGTGIDSADGTGIDSADGTGIDSADGTGIDSADGTGIDEAIDPEEEDG